MQNKSLVDTRVSALLCRCKLMGDRPSMLSLKIRKTTLESIFDENFTSLSRKRWCCFTVIATLTIQPEVEQSVRYRCVSAPRITVWPAHRWLGCRRTFSGVSKTWGPPRDRSAHLRRRRTSCWRSWMLPGLDWGKPATCWLHCRCAWTSIFV